MVVSISVSNLSDFLLEKYELKLADMHFFVCKTLLISSFILDNCFSSGVLIGSCLRSFIWTFTVQFMNSQ